MRKMKNKAVDIIAFINACQNNFSDNGDIFLHGFCYHFALILSKLFDGTIFYEPVENHFLCKLGNSYYDISGEVKLTEKVYPWDSYKQLEPLESTRIIKQCIYKTE